MSQWADQKPQGSFVPGPTPNYAPHPNPPSQAATYSADDKSPFEGDRFKPRKRFNDPFFAVFFVLQLIGYAGLSGYVLHSWISSHGLGGGLGKNQSGTSITLNKHTVYLLLFVTAAALFLSTVYLILVRAFTRIFMHATLIFSFALNIGVCIYMWITRFYSGAIVFTVIAIISVFAYFGFRSRIQFATLLLQVVIDVSKNHKSVFVVAMLSLLTQAALAVWFTFTVAATYTKWTPGNPSCSTGTSCSSGKVAGLIFFEVFSFLWTSQVVGNVALATLAGGPYGSWYYFGPKQLGLMPKNPTLGAFARASTLSLGSIALGSLIVTIFEIIRLLLNLAKHSADAEGHPVQMILACCAELFIGCIEGLVQYFNRYAYIQIALYGKPYISAAKQTWAMFKDRGIDALINDSLVGMTLTWGAYIVGLLGALFAYIYLRVTHPSYNAHGHYTAPVLLFAFSIAVQCSLTLSSAIEAGVSTIFVGLGEDPYVLAVRAPGLFAMIQQRYPDVVQGVPREDA